VRELLVEFALVSEADRSHYSIYYQEYWGVGSGYRLDQPERIVRSPDRKLTPLDSPPGTSGIP